MTWQNHKLTTAGITYALGLPLEGILVAVCASTFPDAVEFIFHSRHRGVSHFWGIYLLLFLLGYLNPFRLPLWAALLLEWFALGCLLHLAEDAMSRAGLEFYPGSKEHKIKLGELYVTRQEGEYLVAFLIAAVCLAVKFFQVRAGICCWRPELGPISPEGIFHAVRAVLR